MSKPKTTAAKPKVPKSKTEPLVARRDATGHIAPKYARGLLGESREKRVREGSPAAFLPRPRTADDLGEELGEAFVQTATSGEDSEAERLDGVVPEEQGGPFVPSKATQEFARGPEASDIEGATREPLPKTSKADP
jgi:hypothetical protein